MPKHPHIREIDAGTHYVMAETSFGTVRMGLTQGQTKRLSRGIVDASSASFKVECIFRPLEGKPQSASGTPWADVEAALAEGFDILADLIPDYNEDMHASLIDHISARCRSASNREPRVRLESFEILHGATNPSHGSLSPHHGDARS